MIDHKTTNKTRARDGGVLPAGSRAPAFTLKSTPINRCRFQSSSASR